MARTPIPWGRLAAEFVVIVVSILLAFGIQAWWDQSQEREQEEALLVALLDEASANAGWLEEYSEFHADQIERVLALQDLHARDDLSISIDSLDYLIAGLTSWSMPVYERGTLDAVLLGGRIESIQSQDLRRQLVVWQRSLSEVADVGADEEYHIRDLWMPLLRSETYMPQIWNTGIERFPEWHAGENPVRGIEDHRGLLRSRDFANVLLLRKMTHEDILAFQARLRNELESLRGLLQIELSR